MSKEDFIFTVVITTLILFIIGLIIYKDVHGTAKYISTEPIETNIPVYTLSCNKIENNICMEYVVNKVIKE